MHNRRDQDLIKSAYATNTSFATNVLAQIVIAGKMEQKQKILESGQVRGS